MNCDSGLQKEVNALEGLGALDVLRSGAGEKSGGSFAHIIGIIRLGKRLEGGKQDNWREKGGKWINQSEEVQQFSHANVFFPFSCKKWYFSLAKSTNLP